MELTHKQDGKKGMFYMEDGGKKIAELAYVFSGDTKLIIEHTEVYPGNEGKGLGKQLVNAVVEFARKNGYKILPVCPYAKTVLERSDAYQDVLF
jgi:predicted GNAT family acetyltransferase